MTFLNTLTHNKLGHEIETNPCHCCWLRLCAEIDQMKNEVTIIEVLPVNDIVLTEKMRYGKREYLKPRIDPQFIK